MFGCIIIYEMRNHGMFFSKTNHFGENIMIISLKELKLGRETRKKKRSGTISNFVANIIRT